jgi:hypothetical protein
VVRATASADLRYVAYISYATNVVRGQVDGNVAPDVFFTDRVTGTTTLVSHAAGSSTMTANAASGNYGDIYLSANGKWLLFGSAATNLVAGETDDNGQNDVFLDRTGTGTVTLVSHAASHPLDATDGFNIARGITPDGSDTNGGSDVFTYERQSGDVALISHIPGSAATAGNHDSFTGQVSADGREVVFSSVATDLVAGFTTSSFRQGIFYQDRASGSTTLVTHAAGSTAAMPNNDCDCMQDAVSPDGSVVLFQSYATNLVAGQVEPFRANELFMWHRASDATTLVSHAAGHPKVAANSTSGNARFSADGSTFTFQSAASDLVTGETSGGGTFNIFLGDRSNGRLELVSHAAGSTTTTLNGSSDLGGVLSADGSYVVFASLATDVVPGQVDTSTSTCPTCAPGTYDVFLWERATGAQRLLTHIPSSDVVTANGDGAPIAVSEDGTLVVFASTATNLTAGQSDSNGGPDIFVSQLPQG